MSWMKKANQNELETLLDSIAAGKLQLNQAAYSLSPFYCGALNSMLLTHPQFTDILHNLIEAVCMPASENVYETQDQIQNQNQNPELLV